MMEIQRRSTMTKSSSSMNEVYIPDDGQ
jgi:hypothetical protein